MGIGINSNERKNVKFAPLVCVCFPLYQLGSYTDTFSREGTTSSQHAAINGSEVSFFIIYTKSRGTTQI